MKALQRLGSIGALVALAACGGGGGDGGGSPPASNGGGGGGAASSVAEFAFDCNLNGANGALTLQVEAVATSGAVWGTGPTPDISAVVASGGVTYYTAGSLVSAVAHYSIRGENQYADFTLINGNERFVVEWIFSSNQRLLMRVNPFGPGPTSHDCQLRSSRRL
jgi:hypothetical protein